MIRIFLALVPFVATSGAIDIKTTVGSAVNFVLPDFHICPDLNLNDPKDNLLLSTRSGIPQISSHVQSRARLDSSAGGPTFTLLNVSYEDEGTYYLETSDGSRRRECEGLYAVTLERDFEGTAYWLAWEPWSSCYDVTSCQRGFRERKRECSIPSRCYHGRGEECEQNVTVCTFYAWSVWSEWLPCSVTCGSGSMRRQRKCSLSQAEDSILWQCGEESEMEATCRRSPCAPVTETTTSPPYTWAAWGIWSTCSMSCGSGWQTRDRKCVDIYEREVHGYCAGTNREDKLCRVAECEDILERPSLVWTAWTGWSTCSASCGSGWQTRYRKCVDEHGRVVTGRCRGDAIQNDTCSSAECKGLAQAPSGGQVTVSLPLWTIVGGAAGVFILVLLVIIVILVVRLRKKTRKPKSGPKVSETRQEMVKPPKEKKGRKKLFARKKSDPRVSRISELHVYAEINDDDVYDKKDERQMSIITIDNEYSSLPRSASPVDSGGHEKGFEFDDASKTYLNVSTEPAGANEAGRPKRRLDSAGYLVPLQGRKNKTVVYKNQ